MPSAARESRKFETEYPDLAREALAFIQQVPVGEEVDIPAFADKMDLPYGSDVRRMLFHWAYGFRAPCRGILRLPPVGERRKGVYIRTDPVTTAPSADEVQAEAASSETIERSMAEFLRDVVDSGFRNLGRDCRYIIRSTERLIASIEYQEKMCRHLEDERKLHPGE